MLFQASALESKLSAIKDVLRSASVQFSILFGSASRGEPFRDLDIGLVLLKPDLQNLLDLGLALEKAAKCPVDCVHLLDAPVAFQHQASKGVLLTAQSLEAFFCWKERVWSAYFDQEHFLKNYAREVIELRSSGRAS